MAIRWRIAIDLGAKRAGASISAMFDDP